MTDAAASPPEGTTARAGGLLIAAAIVAFGVLGSRLLGVLRTVVIAREFGASPELDAYWVAFRVPDLIFTVLAGATMGSAFIPVFARVYRRESTEAAWKLASTVLNLVAVGTAVVCVVAFVAAPWLVPLTAPGLGRDPQIEDQAISLTRFMLLSPLLFSISGMLTGILNARQRFLLSALAPMLYNLSIIAGALLLSGSMGVKGLAVGVVVGAALHLAVQVPGLWRERMRYSFSFDWRDTAVREVGRLMGPRVIGLAAFQFNFVVTVFFASKIGPSAISDLSYAWLVATLPLALFGSAFSMAVFPRLAEHAADGEHSLLRETVSRTLRIIMFLCVPAAVGLAVLRVPATTLLLQRGEFTTADTLVTASALGWYCLGIVPMAGIEIHSRGFYALGDTRTPVTFAVAAVVLNAVLSALLWGPFEHAGLAFSVSIAAWCEWLALYVVYVRRLKADAATDIAALAQFALCAAVMALAIAIGVAVIDADDALTNGIVAVAGSAAGLAVYLGMANLLRIPELGEALSRARMVVLRR